MAIYNHPCNKCIFLGSYKSNDIYRDCDHSFLEDKQLALIRFGNGDTDFTFQDCGLEENLLEKAKEAIDNGLLDDFNED